MSSVPFDTYAAVKRLTETGVPEAQAEALIRAVTKAQARADLATGSDIKDLRQESQVLRQELKQEIQTLRQELKQEIQTLRQELKQDMAALENRFIKWMFVQAIAIISLTVTLVQLLS